MKNLQPYLQTFICIAGVAQIALVMGSLAIPKILNWRAELAKVKPLIKQMFWTYAAYILVINLSSGMLSACGAQLLTDGSKLAMLVNAFIALYWISRVLVQFLYFDRSNFPSGGWNTVGEIILVALFIFLSIVYSWGFCFNFNKP